MGYLHHARSRVDRRSVRISLTAKGKQVHEAVASVYEKHVNTVEQIGGIACEEFERVNQALRPPRALLDRPDPLQALTLSRYCQALPA